MSENSPSIGFSAANRTRKGAPLHGAMGEASTESSATSSQDEPLAWEDGAEKSKMENAAMAKAAARGWRAGNALAPLCLQRILRRVGQSFRNISRAVIIIIPPQIDGANLLRRRHTGAAVFVEILCPICVLTGGMASDIDSFLSQGAENGGRFPDAPEKIFLEATALMRSLHASLEVANQAAGQKLRDACIRLIQAFRW
jgi:hypothetical protein